MNTLDTMFLAIHNFIVGAFDPGYSQAALLGFMEALQEMMHTRIAEIGLQKFNAETELIKLREDHNRLVQELANANAKVDSRKYFLLDDPAVDALVRDHNNRNPNQKIEAIKLVRKLTNCGLKEAKDFCETFTFYKPMEWR